MSLVIGFIQKVLKVLKVLKEIILSSEQRLKAFYQALFLGIVYELLIGSGHHIIKANKRNTGVTWVHSSYSVTVTIPKRLAEKHGLTEPCTVIFEDRPDGILIKKLDLD